ncbi:MAG: tRNA (adenosine(37)-N6)-threonylcarbamoyltransferase complex dimerization subunit type 1 TsaB [Firmicutes bacterium]|nr:tRNA (adenosine(37)-N6)-threonylcarbamoyltransferase complex dimerization subunit type 1 TsaB [Bacillota bacterium]
MLILGLDTATPWGALALGDETDVFLEISLRSGKGGGEYLLSILNRMLVKTGRSLREVELIAAGTGPGSYTGIRVGLAAAKGLAEGLKVPVLGVDTLRIIAENAVFAGEWVAAVIDARRGSVYAALYRNGAHGLQEYWPPCYTDAESFALKLTELPGVVICGDGSKSYRRIWERIPGLRVGPVTWDRPSAANLIQIAARLRAAGITEAGLGLSPSYLRRVEAEVRLEGRINADEDSSHDVGRSG